MMKNLDYMYKMYNKIFASMKCNDTIFVHNCNVMIIFFVCISIDKKYMFR